jgi:hypothetical protein
LKTWPHWKDCYMESCWNLSEHMFIAWSTEFDDKISLTYNICEWRLKYRRLKGKSLELV